MHEPLDWRIRVNEANTQGKDKAYEYKEETREHPIVSHQTTPVIPEKKGDISEKVYLFYEQRPYEPKL